MEPAEGEIDYKKLPRYKLILGKYPVVKIVEREETLKVDVQLNGPVMFTFYVGKYVDVREGDLLTIYTEVLANAKSIETPIQ